ncbi:MAG: hypothetical protein M0031_00835 [Thermaerobacter sp.]|nr:hypothetical protein [Thermaerobacter sp.]
MVDVARSMAVGSLPQKDPHEAWELFLRYTPETLAWPQLPRRDPREDMFAQFTEGLPALLPGPGRRADTSWEALGPALEDFYERYLAAQADDEVALDSFRISREHAAGLHLLLDSPLPSTVTELKGQITGPLSLGLALQDQESRAAYYHEGLHDALVKGLAMKARWQAKQLSERGLPTIVFVDEPSLAYYGAAAFATLDGPRIVRDLDEVVEAIHAAGARAGIHCCANTDGSLAMTTAADLLHFDVYDYPENLLLYPKELEAFLARGGTISWGVVPNRLTEDDPTTLARRLAELREHLARLGVPSPALQPVYISTSCGLGSLREEEAAPVLALAQELARSLEEA